jgi:ribosomal protein S18 acetylase RimI-like enzyme
MSAANHEVEVTIRAATSADFDGVARVFVEENRFHAELVPTAIQVAEPIMTREWYGKLLGDPKRALLVAEIGADIVGVLLLQEVSTPEDPIVRPRRYLYVDEIAVGGAYRG